MAMREEHVEARLEFLNQVALETRAKPIVLRLDAWPPGGTRIRRGTKAAIVGRFD